MPRQSRERSSRRQKIESTSQAEPPFPGTEDPGDSLSDTTEPETPRAVKDATVAVAVAALPSKKQKKRSTWLTFAIGGIAGLLLAGAAAKNQDLVKMELLQDLSLDSIIDVIPAGILKEASDISQREKDAVNYDAFSTGLALKAEGLSVNHPVVMVWSLRSLLPWYMHR